jgi:hypothetical protein
VERENRFGYFFLGLGVGTAVALLFAPKSGEKSGMMYGPKRRKAQPI